MYNIVICIWYLPLATDVEEKLGNSSTDRFNFFIGGPGLLIPLNTFLNVYCKKVPAETAGNT